MSRRNAAHGVSEAAPLFAALGDETRLGLITRLGERGPLSTTRLTEDASVTRQAVTKHLEVLERAGWVSATRHGRERLWQVNGHTLRGAREYLDHMSRRWDDALARLARFVED